MINSSTSDVVYKLGDYAVHKSVDGYNVINTRRSVVTRISKTLLDAVQYIESLVTVFPFANVCLNTYSCKLSEQYSGQDRGQPGRRYGSHYAQPGRVRYRGLRGQPVYRPPGQSDYPSLLPGHPGRDYQKRGN